MNDAELQLAVLQALDQARPDATMAVLRPLLADRVGASQVRLLLANYQLTALRPIQDPNDRVMLRDTPAGEAFVSQLPVVDVSDPDTATVYLPVSIRGDRMGVLQLALPAAPEADDLDQLGRLATVIGYALQAAARQSDMVQSAARSQRLTLAAELQWQLLPGRGCRGPDYQLAGHLEPAYHVHADNFDWSQDGDQLMMSVTDAARYGQVASLLTTLAVTALRNARRAGLDLSEQASMADQAVYAHHQGRQYVSTLLTRIDLTTGEAAVVRAGSPRLFILRDAHVLVPRFEDQLPLGMFEGTEYVEEHLSLATGDRLLLASDGVYAARSPSHEAFGEGLLPQLLKESASLPVGGVVRRVIEELHAHRDLAELDDDAAVICLDWSGPGHIDNIDSVVDDALTTGSATAERRRLRLIPGGRVPGGEGGERELATAHDTHADE